MISISKAKRVVVPPTQMVSCSPYKTVTTTVTKTVTASYSFSESKPGYFGSDDALGGGLSVNYFFRRYFGLGLEADGLTGGTALLVANVLLRYPITIKVLGTPRGIAPYVFAGGGVLLNDGAMATGHIGGGIEFRIRPRVSFFIDGRFVCGSHNTEGGLIRTGLGFTF